MKAFILPGSFLLVLFFLLIPHGVSAVTGINAQIPFSGTLNDSNGTPLTGTYSMKFSIYPVAIDGDPIWTDTYDSVSVTKGVFDVLLGSGGSALTPDFNDDSYYLGVTIGTDPEMTPRQRMGATGYAINSKFLNGLESSSFMHLDQPFNLLLGTQETLFTLEQQDLGDLMRIRSNGNDVFTMQNNGALNVLSSDNSYFAGNIQFSDGSGVYLGSDNVGSGGLTLSVDTTNSALGANTLMVGMYGEATSNNSVSITTPGSLHLKANSMNGPSVSLNEDGSIQISSSFGDEEARVLSIGMMNGVRINEGDLLLENGNIGIGVGVADARLDVYGSIQSTELAGGGTLSADANGNIILDPSDEKLKQNIRTFDNALETIQMLRGVRYEWKDSARFGDHTEIGFIAQELQPVLPEVVREGGEYLTVNYKNIVAVVVEAVKELNAKVSEYFTRTERLEVEVADLRQEIELLKKQNSNYNDVEEETEPVEVSEVAENVTPEDSLELEVIPELESLEPETSYAGE